MPGFWFSSEADTLAAMTTSAQVPSLAVQEGWKTAVRLAGLALRFAAGNAHLFTTVVDLFFGGAALLLLITGSSEAGIPLPFQVAFSMALLVFGAIWNRFGAQGVVFVWSAFALGVSLWGARRGSALFRWKRRLAATVILWALAAIAMPFATLPENRPGMWGVMAVFAAIHIVVGLGASGAAHVLGSFAVSVMGTAPRFQAASNPGEASKNAPT